MAQPPRAWRYQSPKRPRAGRSLQSQRKGQWTHPFTLHLGKLSPRECMKLPEASGLLARELLVNPILLRPLSSGWGPHPASGPPVGGPIFAVASLWLHSPSHADPQQVSALGTSVPALLRALGPRYFRSRAQLVRHIQSARLCHLVLG